MIRRTFLRMAFAAMASGMLGTELLGRVWQSAVVARDPVGQLIFVTSGRGAGQVRQVVDYSPGIFSGVATVSPEWSVVPDEASSVILLPPSEPLPPVPNSPRTIG